MGWFPVDPQFVTPEWLSDVLGVNVSAFSLEQIGIGVGLQGRVYRAHLEGANVPSSVVLKFPTLDRHARSTVCEPLEFYRHEVRFYQEIGLADPLPPARPFFAAFDEATHDFALVLEDLRHLRNADQTVGCTPADAEAVVDAIARHHAHWWESERLAAFPWLGSYTTVPAFAETVAGSFGTGWPRFLEVVGGDLSPELRAFGRRFPSLVPWYLEQIARPPITFCHGDLRLDQLFFAIDADDPPVTALDWQITTLCRGAYDLAYFLSQSLATETRRSYEADLIARYEQRLSEHGIDYPTTELRRDYRLTTAWCFVYPVISAGQFDIANDRQLELLQTMTNGAAAAIEDNDSLALRPD
jgi:hypothetical protein